MNLSVVIPNFNGSQTILETLRSINNQLPDRKEILIVDDCSTDDSIEIIQKQYPSIPVFQNKVNMGAAAARNIGLKETSGEWILFLDADVVPSPTCILDLLKGTATADIIFPRISYPNGEVMYPLNAAQAKYLMISPIFLIRRSSLAKMSFPHFDEIYKIYCEDTDFFLRAFLSGLRCIYIEQGEALHNVRPKPGNREGRYFLEIRNSIYGAIKFAGFWELNEFDHAFKLFNILKLLICGIFNFNLFDMQARGFKKPTNGFQTLHYFFSKHEKLTNRGPFILLLLSVKALLWNITHISQVINARQQFKPQKIGPNRCA